MLRLNLVNVAQRVFGSKCTAPAKSASATYASHADVASAVHANPRECASCSEDLLNYQSRWEDHKDRWPEHLKKWKAYREHHFQQHYEENQDRFHEHQLKWKEFRDHHHKYHQNDHHDHVWKWGVDIDSRYVALMRSRGRWAGCHGYSQGRSQGAGDGSGCEQEWHEKWRACRHDMWSSCHRSWHFLEAVGWGTAAVIGYQITGDRHKDAERCREEHRCIVKRLCAAISSLLSHPWAVCPLPSLQNSSIIAHHMLPRLQSSGYADIGEKHCAESVTAGEAEAKKSDRKKSYTWHDFTEQAAGFKFDKFNFGPKLSHDITQQTHVDIASSVIDGTKVDSCDGMRADSVDKTKTESIDALVTEIVGDWHRLAGEYIASLDNMAAVNKAKRGCFDEAVAEWKEIVEETDNVKALFNLAVSYEMGLGTKQDMSKAMEYYERAAMKGNPKAAFNLAMIILRENIAERQDEVRQLLTAAANQGLPEAQRELAIIYAEDDPSNMAEAVTLFQQAAEKDDMYSCYNLGICYEQGLAVERDMTRAIELYEKAAALGHPDALFTLALYYETGRAGVCEDKDRALTLYQSACSGGHKEAAACVVRLEQELSTTKRKTSLMGETKDGPQLPSTHDTMTRNASSSITFSRLLSTGSDASLTSDDDSIIFVTDDDKDGGWGSDTTDVTDKKLTKIKRHHDSDLEDIMFGKKSSLRTGFFLGFSSEEEEGIGSDVETY